jgi:rubredoxin
MLASVRRSACIPAPPDGSDAANVSTRGGKPVSLSGMEEFRGARGEGAARGTITIQFARVYSTALHRPPMKKYMCLICGWIYDEATGAPEEGIPPGTRWEDVPPNWTCPECGARKEDFEMIEF